MENLLLDDNFNLKIGDFGYSSFIGGKKGDNVFTSRVGTPTYMAPEVILNVPYNAIGVDIFTTGVILFMMITRTPPF
jgi:serine/threonine protein kinase